MAHDAVSPAEQLPLFGAESESGQAPSVSLVTRATALLTALEGLSQASGSEGYQVTLEANTEARNRAKGGPAHAQVRAREKEQAALLWARQAVIRASGYVALAESGLVDPDDAKLAEVGTWATFRKAYAGGQNAAKRRAYSAVLKSQLRPSAADAA